MIYGTQGEGLKAELLGSLGNCAVLQTFCQLKPPLAKEQPLPGALLFLLELQQRLFR
jgi:hypothetical protein